MNELNLLFVRLFIIDGIIKIDFLIIKENLIL